VIAQELRNSARLADLARLVVLGCASVLLVAVALEQLGLLGEAGAAFGRRWLVTSGITAAAIACALRAALVREERLAWTLFAVAIGGYAAGQIYWVVWLETLMEPPFPSISDGLWLAVYPLSFLALVLIGSRRLRGFHAGIWLDGAVCGAALAALWQAVAFGPILSSGEGLDTLSRATLLAYPFGDLLLIGVAAGVFALSEWSPGPAWLLLGGGFVLFAAADTVYNAMVAQGEFVASLALTSLWPLGLLAVALAAWVPVDRRAARGDSFRGLFVPSAATGLALGILVYGSFRTVGGIATVLAALAIVAGICRAFFTLRELRSLSTSREEAVTDYLTGLGNRRLLMRDLAAVFRAGKTTTLLLFDLDGFKTYNDQFGHVQGDLLLARLGGRLALAVSETGRAYRLGGDEFCVLLPGDAGSTERAAELACALNESGRGFRIGCASGSAILPGEARDASEALRLADTRMYAQKNGRPGAAKRQAADVALRILAEQQPALGRHVDAVCVQARRGSRPAHADGDQRPRRPCASRRAARHREDRDSREHSGEARTARRGGVASRAEAHARGGENARDGAVAPACGSDRALHARTVRRHRVSGPPRRRGDSAGGAHHRGVRRSRRDDVPAPVPRCPAVGGRAGGDPALLRLAIRSCSRRGTGRGARGSRRGRAALPRVIAPQRLASNDR